MAHLKGTLDAFVQRLFGEDIVTRLRPNYFPFTEPSAEIDCHCWICGGTGSLDGSSCRTCGGTGWIELGGSGMVNHRVLRAAGRRPRALLRVRVRAGHRAVADAAAQRGGHARHRRGRRPLLPAVRNGDLMYAPVSWLRELADLPAGGDRRRHRREPGARGPGGGGAARRRHLRTPGRRARPVRPARAAEERQDDQLVHGRRGPERPAAHRGQAAGDRLRSPQLRSGDLVVCVLPGGVLPGGFEISARKTYGHVSNGMICSAKELGLGDDHDGIIVLNELLGEEAAARARARSGRHRAARAGRRGRRGQRHARPRLLLLDARHRA